MISTNWRLLNFMKIIFIFLVYYVYVINLTCFGYDHLPYTELGQYWFLNDIKWYYDYISFNIMDIESYYRLFYLH